MPIHAPRSPVHPHGRGEHLAALSVESSPNGSSPRAWGTPSAARTAAIEGRFIPTGVGNTDAPRSPRTQRAVHPHGRGEHDAKKIRDGKIIGSSPRAWGTRAKRPHQRAKNRFIPTGVGNTPAIRPASIASAVHPHGRGEHGRCPHHRKLGHGSSPRAWGTRRPHRQRGQWRRFIPTGVGNTWSVQAVLPSGAVHPHGRGEHEIRHAERSGAPGSSPRAWGTPGGRRASLAGRRFIPTGVGNTQ